MTRLSVVLIAKNERENVWPCFESFWDHCDEVVLCDTGSCDGTVAEARRVASGRGEPDKLIVGRFKWCDDFAAARNHAHSLATGDVHVKHDLDDRLIGAKHLRDLADQLDASPEVGMIAAEFSGPLCPGQFGPLLLRAPVQWRGPTWERPAVEGPSRVTTRVRVETTRTCLRGRRGRRDLDIALRWAEADPADWRPLEAAAHEAASLEEWATVKRCASRGLSLRGLDAETTAVLCLLSARAHEAQGHHSEAEEFARRAISSHPKVVTAEEHLNGKRGELDARGTVHGAWLVLARCALDRCELDEAISCAIESGQFALTEDGLAAARDLAETAAAAMSPFGLHLGGVLRSALRSAAAGALQPSRKATTG